MTDESDTRRLRILAEIAAVPSGRVASYGAIARRAGYPRCARLVARILRDNDDADVPWHRILRSDGRIAFAPDSAQFDEQCGRLRAEGVEVLNGRVRQAGENEERWLDRLLWGDAGGD